MPTVKVLVTQHPLASYFLLTFVISWGGVLWVVGGPAGIPGTTEQQNALLPVAVLVMLLGPSIAGIGLTGLVSGRAGLRDLFARCLRWRVPAGWYAIALLAAPFVAASTLLLLSLWSPAFLPGIVTAEGKGSVLLVGLAGALSAGVFEEVGWTGFALPRLRARCGVIASGLCLGVVWGAWHLFVNWWGSGTSTGTFSASLFVLQFVFYAVVLPPFRVLMVWVYDRTGSVLVAMLMHASLTGSDPLILTPSHLQWTGLVTWRLIVGAVLWTAVAALAVRVHRRRPGGTVPSGVV